MIDTLGYDVTRPVFLPSPLNRHHRLNGGLVSKWLCVPGLDGGNSWYDISGQSHLALTSVPTGYGWKPSTRPGAFGQMYLDGAGAQAVGGVVAPLQSFSLSIWSKPDTVPAASAGLIDQGYAEWFLLAPLYGLWSCYVGGAALAGTAIVPGEWMHIMVTCNGTVAKLFQNGQLMDSSSAFTITGAGHTWRIGAKFNGANPWNGAVDDCNLWSRGLSDVEVKAYYDLSRMGYAGLLNRIAPSPTGDVNTLYLRSFAVNSTTAPSFTRGTNKAASATSTSAAAVTRSAGKVLSATSTGGAVLARALSKSVSVVGTTVATLAKRMAKSVSATSAAVASMVAAIREKILHVIHVIRGGGIG